jgi:hypothetical protein
MAYVGNDIEGNLSSLYALVAASRELFGPISCRPGTWPWRAAKKALEGNFKVCTSRV